MGAGVESLFARCIPGREGGECALYTSKFILDLQRLLTIDLPKTSVIVLHVYVIEGIRPLCPLQQSFQLISAKGAAFVPWQPIELSDLLRFSALLTVKVCDLPLPHESR